MDYTDQYYRCSRLDLVSYISPGAERVLDVGCGEGVFGETLKEQGLARIVIGIELVPTVAELAASRLDHVICGDLETLDKNVLGLEARSFDYIICGDVLEHFRDPWQILTWLVSLLKEDGKLIASIPNVRHWSVVLPLLLRGKWKYKTHGIMDRTHLRFFTRDSAIALFRTCGLHVENCIGSKLNRKIDKLVNITMLGLGKEFVTTQWTLIGILNKWHRL